MLVEYPRLSLLVVNVLMVSVDVIVLRDICWILSLLD